MNPVMYIIANPALKMTPGKLAAQVAHAAVEAYRLSCKRGPDLSDAGLLNMPGITSGRTRWVNEALFEESSIANRWRRGGHYTKIVLMADDLNTAFEYIGARGFNVVKIIDEGRTEFDGRLTPTAIGVEIVDKDSAHVQETFGAFKLYREATPVQPLSDTTALLDRETYDKLLYGEPPNVFRRTWAWLRT